MMAPSHSVPEPEWSEPVWVTLLRVVKEYGLTGTLAVFLVWQMTQNIGGQMSKIITNQELIIRSQSDLSVGLRDHEAQMAGIMKTLDLIERAMTARTAVARANCINNAHDEAARQRCVAQQP